MILGYVRLSTTDQSSSIETQTNVIEGYARTRGVDKFGVQIYCDNGVSGATKLSFRPAGGQLLADMKPGDTVIASKLDRMFRSAVDAINMFDVFKARGVDLVLYDIGHEPVGAGVGKLLLTILAAVADMERVRIRERITEGLKLNKAKGRPIGNAGMGFRKVGVRRESTLEVNEAEQRAAARMLDLFQQTRPQLSRRQIGRVMAEEGFLSRTGKPYSHETIGQVVARMLQ